MGKFFKPIRGIAGYQNFTVTKEQHGTLILHHSCTADAEECNLLLPGVTLDHT